MIHEKSCGAVIWRKNPEDIHEYLILQHAAAHWAYAKGHVENNESEKETALREIKEETGLTVELHMGFREINIYSPHPRVEKTVIYFLAEADPEAIVRVQEEEISHARWLPYQQARELLSFPNDRKILDKADHLLTTAR